ncbi:heparan-alpha-glucosaminide N-acetyltransferase domain-containing protein [Sphingomonas yunnanensis]|uniref:DUF1624 domain-containing protein n=1 Tax=Sphingomonas yunnanensis TaxID=310400 RepID=UPI001CA66AFC|nr:heparan-alpha-glucosaminide N-acetyltransferase domain-containing protein [Sphingomonas yunnanensis]MBY9063736.1 heparan-alpha-glucosaminide N-acetyltransferase domain-containing protein [Sphingomonas yunnanensis]
MLQLTASPPPQDTSRAAANRRLDSIDALRGLAMLLMLADHTREYFFLSAPVSDPMDLRAATPGLVAARLAAHLCAPVFVALAGISAWLYGAARPRAAAARFLIERGLFLLLLELTLVGFAWSFSLSPTMIYLQVIWAIGWSMIALAGLLWLPRAAVVAAAVVLVAGHNLLDPVRLAADHPLHPLWAILHQRDLIALGGGVTARTSYPVLPWIGVIALGYAVGPWFQASPASRRRALSATGALLLLGFVLLRAINRYGDPVPWQAGTSPLPTLLSFLNLTKYPPSLGFLLATLGLGALLLAGLEQRAPRWLTVLGSAPMFFYLLHLYALHLLAVAAGGRELPTIGHVWLLAAVVAPPLWWATRWFAGVKRRSASRWLRFF